jgi:hypothetical protein
VDSADALRVLARARPDWLTTIRRYLIASIVGHLVWETVQLPLYTLWSRGTAREIGFAVMHCSSADLLIATTALTIALVTVGFSAWPGRRFVAVLATTVIVSASYTIYSEYMNTVVRQSWAYAASMPTLPWLGTGVSPLAQWMIVPALALTWAGRRATRSGRRAI